MPIILDRKEYFDKDIMKEGKLGLLVVRFYYVS